VSRLLWTKDLRVGRVSAGNQRGVWEKGGVQKTKRNTERLETLAFFRWENGGENLFPPELKNNHREQFLKYR